MTKTTKMFFACWEAGPGTDKRVRI